MSQLPQIISLKFWNWQDLEMPEIKLPTSVESLKKQENSKKTSTSASLTMPKPLTVWITTNWGKFFNRWEYQTTLPASWDLYAGQEATDRTGHRTTDWFQIGKGVHQGCILSPCFFNLYVEWKWKWSEVAQSCLTLCDPMDCSLSGFSVHGIFQARILEWVAISFSRDLPDPGIKPGSPALQADAFTLWATREAYVEYITQNARLDEAQAGIKIASRNINNLRYADDTNLWQKVKRN